LVLCGSWRNCPTRQAIALQDVVVAGGESFAITRAIVVELNPDGQLLPCQVDDPGAFREQAKAQLGLDVADDHPAARSFCALGGNENSVGT
jgi:hypothetical protein